MGLFKDRDQERRALKNLHKQIEKMNCVKTKDYGVEHVRIINL